MIIPALQILLCIAALLARTLVPTDIIPLATWLALLSQILLHLGAVAVSQRQSRKIQPEDTPGIPPPGPSEANHGILYPPAILHAAAEGTGIALLSTTLPATSSWHATLLGLSACMLIAIGIFTNPQTNPASPQARSTTIIIWIARATGALATASVLGAKVPQAIVLVASAATGCIATVSNSHTPIGSKDHGIPRNTSPGTHPGTPHQGTQLHEQLLSTLAHEIRTPLTIMQTAGTILLEETPGTLNERQRKFLESIRINIQRLITFSETVLTAIKLDRRITPDRTTAIDLRIIIRHVAQTMQPLLSQRSQQLQCTFPALLSRPFADEGWIRQVLVNLVHNASKHTPQGGLVMISVTQDDQQVVVTVTDNGSGLFGPGREALFREFYQEQPNSLSGLDGFGLGLSIVRAMIEAHGGTVRIGSSPEHGTMVSFTLPAETDT